MKLEIGASTDRGKVREGNEDSFVVDERMGLIAVADGMGGHRAGEVASATALEALRANVASGLAIRDAIVNANLSVFEKAASDEDLLGMGTTVTAATVATGDTLLVGHVGDSRLYLLRDGEFRRVTEDHSLVEEMVRDGQLTREQAAVHPRRSIITRSVGIDETVDVDVVPIELGLGDRLLFCTDGLTDMLREDDIATLLRRESDPQRAAAALVAEANDAGGEDNITAVVVDAVAGESLVVNPAAALFPDPVSDDDSSEVPGDPSEPSPEDPSNDGERPKPRWRRVGRAVARVLVWAVPILLVIAIGIGAVGWYARSTYFVTLDDDRVVLYKGRPGGVLGWDPTVELETDLSASDLTGAQLDDLTNDQTFGSREDAEEYLAILERSAQERSAQERSAATTTTTTTPVTEPVAP